MQQTAAMEPHILVSMATVILSLLVAMVTGELDFGGCGCLQEDDVIRCAGVSSFTNISINTNVDTLQVDCMGRSQIRTFNKDDILLAKELEHLTINHCSLESIGKYAFDNLDLLVDINLKGNSLKDIHQDAFIVHGSELKQVISLDMSYNKLALLPYNMFNYMTNVEDVILRHNHITELSDGLFINPQSMTYLDLGENRLHYIDDRSFRELRSLEKLYLDSNLLSFVNGSIFPEQNRLVDLELSGNSIVEAATTCSRLPYLTHLRLANNRLTSLTGGMLQGCSALWFLDLEGNKITDVSGDAFQNTPSLVQLWLGGNSLTVLHNFMFTPLLSLSRLGLENNALNTLEGQPFHNLTGLYFLNLSGNSLEVLHSGSFGGLGGLQTLDIGYNQIATISSSAFEESLTSTVVPSKLILSHNNLSNIESMAFSGIRVSELKLDNSPSLSGPGIHGHAFVDSTVATLNMSGCEVGNLDFLHPSSMGLQTLDLSYQTQPLLIPTTAFENVTLSMFLLTGSSVQSLDFLPQTAVNTLILDQTNVKTHLPRLVVGSDSAYFRNIRTLSLRENNLESIDEIAHLIAGTDIDTLDLSENRFQVLKYPVEANHTDPDTVQTRKLRTFIMNNNHAEDTVQMADTFLAQAMYEVSLVGSKVSALLNATDGLEVLRLGGVDWKEDPHDCFNSFFREQSLSITNAGLSRVPRLARGSCQWTEVILAHNQLTKIYTEDFVPGPGERGAQLRRIDLSHNNIYAIEYGAFDITGLEEVNLSHNDLRSLDYITMWLTLSLTRKVDLSFNDIQTLQKADSDLVFSADSRLSLVSNPFHCNCEMDWVTDLTCLNMQTNNGYVPDLQCVTPTTVSFKEIVPDDIDDQCVKPQILTVESHELPGGMIVISCLATGDPLPTVYWYGTHSNYERIALVTVQPPTDKSSMQTAASVLVNVQETDFVAYECKANTSAASSGTSRNFVPVRPTAVTTESLSTDTTPVSASDSDKKYTAGEMVGAIIGTLIICILIICLILFLLWKRKQKQQKRPPPEEAMNSQPTGTELEMMEDSIYDGMDNNNQPQTEKPVVSVLRSIRQKLNPKTWRLHKRESVLSESASDGIPADHPTPPAPPPRDHDLNPPPVPSKLDGLQTVFVVPLSAEDGTNDNFYDDTEAVDTSPIGQYLGLGDTDIEGKETIETYDCLDENTRDSRSTIASDAQNEEALYDNGEPEEHYEGVSLDASSPSGNFNIQSTSDGGRDEASAGDDDMVYENEETHPEGEVLYDNDEPEEHYEDPPPNPHPEGEVLYDNDEPEEHYEDHPPDIKLGTKPPIAPKPDQGKSPDTFDEDEDIYEEYQDVINSVSKLNGKTKTGESGC